MPPTGFRQAHGSSSWLFIALGALVWLLLPLAHPVYLAMVVPYLLLGAVVAIRLSQRRSVTTSIAPWAASASVPEAAWWKRAALWVVSVLVAFVIPLHPGFDTVGNTFASALRSGAWLVVVGTSIILACLAWAVHVLLEAVASVLLAWHDTASASSKAP